MISGIRHGIADMGPLPFGEALIGVQAKGLLCGELRVGKGLQGLREPQRDGPRRADEGKVLEKPKELAMAGGIRGVDHEDIVHVLPRSFQQLPHRTGIVAGEDQEFQRCPHGSHSGRGNAPSVPPDVLMRGGSKGIYPPWLHFSTRGGPWGRRDM